MNSMMQYDGAARVSKTTDIRVRQSPYRGEALTVRQVMAKTALSSYEVFDRINSGEVDASHLLVVDSADFADDISAHMRRGIEGLLREAGVEPTAEHMAKFGFQPLAD
jgi:hypothetical protein